MDRCGNVPRCSNYEGVGPIDGVRHASRVAVQSRRGTIHGMRSLLLLAIGLIVFAILDRRLMFSLAVAGFVCLVRVSCLYDVVNLCPRLHIGGRWSAQYQLLPNLLSPSSYLFLDSAIF